MWTKNAPCSAAWATWGHRTSPTPSRRATSSASWRNLAQCRKIEMALLSLYPYPFARRDWLCKCEKFGRSLICLMSRTLLCLLKYRDHKNNAHAPYRPRPTGMKIDDPQPQTQRFIRFFVFVWLQAENENDVFRPCFLSENQSLFEVKKLPIYNQGHFHYDKQMRQKSCNKEMIV